MGANANIADNLRQRARERPDAIALRCPGRDGRYRGALTLRQLDLRSDAIARGLRLHGLQAGERAVVMLRPTPEFFLAMFALFKLGAVPVLVDPGIGRRTLRQCLADVEAQAFIGVPLAMAARLLLGWARGARLRVSSGARAWLADTTLGRLEQAGAGDAAPLPVTRADDVAAILFTSGSTGVPKGVVYRHRNFLAQVEMLRTAFDIAPGGVDLPTFPPFALYDPALGLASIIPDMDPTRPARADPRKLHAAIARFGVDRMFGSPALMRVLAAHGAPLPTLRSVASAGAPVPPDVVAALLRLLPQDARLWTPYGATECLPVAVIEGRELLATRARTEAGAGTCVGVPVAPNVVRIIAIDDGAIADWRDARELPQGRVGEITVAGPTATDAYFHRPGQTRLAKIRETLAEGGTRTVHRMGDLGWIDAGGRLWFCGRKSQRVVVDASTTLCTEQVEPVFNVHPQVARTALVGIGPRDAQAPLLCVELERGVLAREWPRIERELRHLADGHVHTARVEAFLRHPRAFPVDIRHNAKIGREALARWAAHAMARGGSPR